MQPSEPASAIFEGVVDLWAAVNRSDLPHCSVPAPARPVPCLDSQPPRTQPANLSGYLARPASGLSVELGGPSNGGAPYPAVVVLRGCNGNVRAFRRDRGSAESLGVRDPCR